MRRWLAAACAVVVDEPPVAGARRRPAVVEDARRQLVAPYERAHARVDLPPAVAARDAVVRRVDRDQHIGVGQAAGGHAAATLYLDLPVTERAPATAALLVD